MTRVSESLRRLVFERANGCCEYCLLSQEDNFFPHEVDHIISEKHRGTTTADNLCLSCLDCNRHKGSDISSIDTETNKLVPLFNPRRDRWNEHFRLDGARIVSLTPIGRVTEYLLMLNSAEQLAKRSELMKLKRYPRIK